MVVNGFKRIMIKMKEINEDIKVIEMEIVVREERNNDIEIKEDRMIEMRNMVEMRKIGIEIIFEVEERIKIDMRIKEDEGEKRMNKELKIDERKNERNGRIKEREIGVRIGKEWGGREGKKIRLWSEMRMELNEDEELKIEGRKRDEEFGLRCKSIDNGN